MPTPPSTNHVDLVLDSGAYSAWKKQEDLPIDAYIAFIKKHEGCFSHVVNLDVIPGEWGTVPTPAEVDACATRGYKNLNILKRREGFDVMPVFHQGEDFKWLNLLISEGYEYIGISPSNDRTTKQKQVWLDKVFRLLCGTKGYPIVKTHGFGMTALPLMHRYPWFSVDSVTWLLIGGYGGMLLPVKNFKGEYDYTRNPEVIQISDRQPGKNQALLALEPGKHIDTLGSGMRKYVEEYLESEGLSLEGMRTDYVTRQTAGCKFFKRASDSYTPRRYKRKVVGFFDGKEKYEGRSEPWGQMKTIFTLTTSPQHSGILEDEGIKDRLLTFYYFHKAKTMPFNIHDYVKTGRIPYSPRGKGDPKEQQLALAGAIDATQ